MNKEKVMNRFIDMIDAHIETVSNMKDYEPDDIRYELDEVLIVVWTISEVTELTKEEMNAHLKEKTGYEVKDIEYFLR